MDGEKRFFVLDANAHSETHNQMQMNVPMFRSPNVPITMIKFLGRFAMSPYLAEPCDSRSIRPMCVFCSRGIIDMFRL